MLIEIAQAGVISDAPSVYELIVRATQMILNFVGALAVLTAVISGVVYITSSGNSEQQRLAKNVLTGSVIGLVIALISLVIVGSLTKLFS